MTRQASVEIEITPEMIEAGCLNLSLHCGAFYDSSYFSEAEVVQEVYIAMRRLEGRDRASDRATEGHAPAKDGAR